MPNLGLRPTRRRRTLAGFMLKAEIDGIARQNSWTLHDPSLDVADAGRMARRAREGLPAIAPARIAPLPDALHASAATVRSRPTFARNYERVAEYEFGLAPINSLIAPQCDADLDYVDELARALGDAADPDRLFEFAMPVGTLTPPIVAGNTIVFSSTRLDLFVSPVPRIEPNAAGGFSIIVDAEPRPNLVQVVVLGDRLFLTNGVHKVLAAGLLGATTIPCVFRVVAGLGEIGLSQGLRMFQPDVVGGPRPALVVDFHDEQLAIDFDQPSTSQVLRVAVMQETYGVPAPVSAAA